MQLLGKDARPTFGGHEKFVFRYGWLKKGIDAAVRDSLIFARDHAPVSLGVGKNMVRAIRHWCLATGLLMEARAAGAARALQPTPLAQKLLTDDGWDPYLEDIGTLWVIHWQLVSNLERSLVWHLAFSAYVESEFTKKQLAAFVGKQLEQASLRTTQGMVEREVDCCLRTYVQAGPSQKPVSEDSLDCPLVELGLIRLFYEEGTYHFNVGPKTSLPPQVFGYALLTFLAKLAHTRRTVAVDETVYQHGSPGQAFKLDENSTVEYLEWLELFTHGGLRLQETAGLRQVHLSEELSRNTLLHSMSLLRDYYERGR